MSFYSPIDRLAQALPRAKGTGAEFMTELSKRPGYKPQEAEDRGLQALMNLPKMERAQFMAALKAKPPVVPEAGVLQKPHHEKYTLPGGENYREILLKHPQGKFEGVAGHFGNEPNILASVRVKDRKGPNGEKVLHLEELQSDWHQQGREKGYTSNASEDKVREAYNALPYNAVSFDELLPKDKEYEIKKYRESGVSDAPFKKNWHEMALKKMIHHAAKNGYDAIAITPGQEQADRYSLAKHVDEISHNPRTNMLTGEKSKSVRIDMKSGSPIQLGVANSGVIDNVNNPDHTNLIGKHLSDVVGKDLSKNIMSEERGILSPQNLIVGGEGMKGFYDKIVPGFLNQFGKKYGAQVGTMPLDVKQWKLEGQMPKLNERQAILHHFPITPEMREDVVKNGVPLYADGGGVHMSGGGSLLSQLESYIRNTKGEYGAKRVQRAADEIPGMENMYTLDALKQAFDGDNAKALMTMDPADFEKFAVRLFSDPDTREEDMNTRVDQGYGLPPMNHDEYIKYLGAIKGGFSEVPFLDIDKRLGYLPNILGHEGRHRARALAKKGTKKSLVRLFPTRSMREEMPRRSQEDFIEAMKKELGERRLVTGQGRSLLPADLEAPEHKNIERRNMLGGRPQLPEIYNEGGSIKPIGYTKERVTVSPNLDAMRYELESVKHYTKKAK